MSRVKPNTVEEYLNDGCGRCKFGGTPDCKVHTWQDELKELMRIARDCELTEEIKWDCPCYSYNGANVLMIAAFKEQTRLSFFKGTLLQDTDQLLVSPGENSQSVKFFQFTNVKDILKLEPTIKAYLYESVEVEKAGLKVNFKQKEELVYPEELEIIFAEKPDLQEAFEALTPGRKRGYILHFAQPKQSQTRASRIEKCIPKIMQGLGFHDR